MKRTVFIGFLLVFAACTPSVKVFEFAETPSPELAAIDSLMWQRPDSALAVLQAFAASPAADSLDVFDGHYCQLLVSELLYKNDYQQSNRPNLLRAVSYFDSLTFTLNDKPSHRHLIAGADPLSLTRSDNLIFLDARAHYINGVGYYERDSVVEACGEYLKALKTMEEHFEEKKLVGYKAKFMALTYNRLGDMFEEQFMMEPAVDCYRHSYDYSIVSPISSYSVSNALYRIGKQLDMKGEKDSANYYYTQAIENLPDSANLFYRNIVSNQALLSYQLTHRAEPSLKRLKQMAVLAVDDDERLARYLLMGGIYFEEGFYDSAGFYLDAVSENDKDIVSLIQAARYLHVIYDSLGLDEKANECLRFLALQKKTEGENKALVSRLEDQFKTYQDQKQKKQSETMREKAVKKVLKVIILFAVLAALIIIVFAKSRSKKLLKEQQSEADRVLGEAKQEHEEELRLKQAEAEKMLEDKEKQHQRELVEKDKQHAEAMETEQQEHQIKQAALSGRLKRSNEKVRELKEQLKRQDELDATPKQTELFKDEPICRLIMERVSKGQFKSQMDCTLYKRYALEKEQVVSLHEAADRHFNGFTLRLAKTYPELTQTDLDYCCLYLLGLTDADVSALMQKAYSTISQRTRKIKAVFGKDTPLGTALRNFANGTLY